METTQEYSYDDGYQTGRTDRLEGLAPRFSMINGILFDQRRPNSKLDLLPYSHGYIDGYLYNKVSK